MTSPTLHVPVMPEEILRGLSPRLGATVVDGTLGGGGHTKLLAEAVGEQGLVIALDRDEAALSAAERNLTGLPVKIAQANFCELPEVLDEIGIERVDGSDQLADEGRGFSFDSQGPLDLRFSRSEGDPAWRLVNQMQEANLADLIYRYGEERHSRRIARAIVEERKKNQIRTAAELAQIVRRSVPRSPRARIDPATRTFQALRIAVNDELKSLEIALKRLPDCLDSGGRLAIISFHSLEDRMVKEAFRDDPRMEIVTRRPVRPSAEEVSRNPRSRSAKLRVAARRTRSE